MMLPNNRAPDRAMTACRLDFQASLLCQFCASYMGAKMFGSPGRGELKLDLSQTGTIAGIKIKMVRDAIREMARHNTTDAGWTVNGLADHMNISPTHAEWLSDLLVDRQVLERKPPASWDRDPVPRIRYALGEYGTRFMLARLLKRIDRAKVEEIIADLLTRVKQINADPNLCYFVNEIRLFGSAADRSADSFGDVDIAYELGRRKRPPEYKEWFDWSRARSDLAGRSNLDLHQMLDFAEKEVRGLIKHRNQYLSLHSIDDVVGIGAESTRLFIVSEGEVDSDDGLVGEKLHQLSMKRSRERAERKKAKQREPTIEPAKSPERAKQSMISALRSLAFDLIRVIEEGSPIEALEQTIRAAHQRIEEFRKLDEPDDLAAIFCETLSIDLCEKRSEPTRFVFSEDRERMELDGTF
jgi:predicted nucleotidyltransferase